MSFMVRIDNIFVRDRSRKSWDAKKMDELQTSLTENGQFQNIVVRKTTPEEKQESGKEWYLLIGGRRCIAATFLGWEELRAEAMEDLEPWRQKVVELQENLAREDMSPFDVLNAKGDIHRLMQENQEGWTQQQTARMIGETPANLSRDLALDAEVKKNPELRKSSSKKAAARTIAMQQHYELRANNAEWALETRKIPEKIFTGDCRDILKRFPPHSFDIGLHDPPFGIDYWKQGHKMLGTAQPGISEYDDTEENSRDTLTNAVPQMVRVLKPTGWLIIKIGEGGYDFVKGLVEDTCLEHWDYVEPKDQYGRCTVAMGKGLQPGSCRYPKVEEPKWYWYRPNSRNPSRYPELHAQNVIEQFVVANIGQGKLLRPCNNLLVFDAVYGDERVHAHQWPLELCKDIITRVALPGDRLIDAFAGSGTSGAAAADLGLDFVQIEKNPALRGTILGMVAQYYRGEKA